MKCPWRSTSPHAFSPQYVAAILFRQLCPCVAIEWRSCRPAGPHITKPASRLPPFDMHGRRSSITFGFSGIGGFAVASMATATAKDIFGSEGADKGSNG
ncbi:hypothetical protein BDR06DRAFT_954162 [Suillus hirtellus]|nr:hypothetical protein BDR06DRAFT_954162 [Suillus hirtellus]